MLVVEAYANGVRAPVLDDGVGNRLALDDRGGVSGDLLSGKAEARGDGWIDAKGGGWTADGVRLWMIAPRRYVIRVGCIRS